MKATLQVQGKRASTLNLEIAEISNSPFVRILPSWRITSDHKPRRWSIDFKTMKDYNPLATNGMPDQFAAHVNQWIELRQDKQFLWMNACCLAAYGQRYDTMNVTMKKIARVQWAGLTHGGRAFTNGRGWNNGRRDYIQPYNPTATKMVEQENVVCSTNLLKVIGDPVPFTLNYLGVTARHLHYPVEALDPTKPLPAPEELLEKPWLCHTPTTATVIQNADGSWKVDPFHWFNSESRYIFWAKGGIAYYRCDWVEPA